MITFNPISFNAAASDTEAANIDDSKSISKTLNIGVHVLPIESGITKLGDSSHKWIIDSSQLSGDSIPLGDDEAYIQYDSTDKCINFVFA